MKRIVIIGASTGIGKRVATDFARKGWNVAIAARSEEKLKQIATQSPGKIVYEAIDVTDQDCVTRLNDLIEANEGMDVLLYAAGVGFCNPQLDIATDRNIINVNVVGFTRIINAAYKYFKTTSNVFPGRIAAITSVAGTKGLGICPSYSASKRYQQNYLQAIDQLAHMQHVDVGVTDIRPGFVRTALLDPDKTYPVTMALDYAAPLIEKAIIRRRRVATIDWRWNIITGIWRLIPNCLWPSLNVTI